MSPENGMQAVSPEPEKPHILVVDDLDKDQLALCQLIQDAGYRVTGASSAKEALAAIGKGPVALVVTELLVPDINGWDLLERIKSRYPHVRVVVITGSISDEGEAMLTSLKADGYLVKPVIPRRMEALFRALLSPQNLGREAQVYAVDRDAATLRTIEETLGERGIYVTAFTDMNKALYSARRDAPDLIATELNLGAHSGFDLCRAVRSMPDIAFIPILVVTDHPSKENVLKAVKLRVNGFLSKPFGKEALINRVFHLLQQAGGTRLEKK